MANEVFDESIPANTEGVRLGAQRFREMRTTLNLLLKQFWSDAAGTLKAKSVNSTMLANDAAVDGNRAVGTDHIKDASVTAAKLGPSAAVPAGSLLAYAGAAAPSGFLLCAGQAVSRATYAALFTALGGVASPYGPGDGATTFNVPDLRGRSPWGLDNMNGSAASRLTTGTGSGTTLGAADGEQQHTLSVAELPVHHHTVLSQSVAFNTGSGAGGILAQGGSVNTGDTGSGTAHQNMPPYLLINYIIKT